MMGAASRAIGFGGSAARLEATVVGERRIAAPQTQESGRVLIVANRLPFTAERRNAAVEFRPANGGLVSALRRVHARSNGLWIGCAATELLEGETRRVVGDRLRAERMATVPVSSAELAGFYSRYANGILWPALHSVECPSPDDRCGWEHYRRVNERFAQAVSEIWRPGDTIWVHDYQLMLLPALLRARLPEAPIGFFLHTPVPNAGDLTRLQEWRELANGVLGADVVGFQTHRFAINFTDAVSASAIGRVNGVGSSIHVGARDVRVISCPIAVDGAWFAQKSRQPAVLTKRAALRSAADGPLFVGIDRLDYTKAIPERLLAFERLLSFEPELRGRGRFVQVAVPSRQEVNGYRETRECIDATVVRINAKYGTERWTPIECIHGTLSANDLVALYCAADVMAVTPRVDGMNLVAKEFVASRTDGAGALVLSRTAGAAAELRAAVLVDAPSVESIMEGYRRALRMSASESRSRMRRLRSAVAARDVFAWSDEFLAAVNGAKLQ